MFTAIPTAQRAAARQAAKLCVRSQRTLRMFTDSETFTVA